MGEDLPPLPWLSFCRKFKELFFEPHKDGLIFADGGFLEQELAKYPSTTCRDR